MIGGWNYAPNYKWKFSVPMNKERDVGHEQEYRKTFMKLTGHDLFFSTI